MKKSPEIQHLENSIAALVSSITDAINSKIQTAISEGVPGAQNRQAGSVHKNAIPPGFVGFDALAAAVPLSARTLREQIKRGQIPTIRLPGGRRLLFHLPSVEKSLLRFQRGGIAWE